MSQLSLVLCALDLTPLPATWAVEQVLSATVMMEELDRFSPHSITVSGSFRQNLALLQGLAVVQIIDADVGTIAYGLLDDPEDQITAEDRHTITLTLPNITEDLRYQTTGQGFVAGYIVPSGTVDNSGTAGLTLDQIVQRLGAHRYGWRASCVGGFGQFQYVLRYEDANILGALLQAADVTGGHARQGRDASGAPIKTIEIGTYGDAPTIEIITPEGGNADQILANNPNARLARTITRHPADCTKLVNTMTPLGAGEGTNQVRFRRLFSIMHDPTYDHYWGANREKKADYFPEYDDNYPIPAALDFAGTVRPARPAKGDANKMEVAARLDGGANGYEYCIVNLASLNEYNRQFPHAGEFRAPFSDSTFSYVDSNSYNQEYSERALYLAAKAELLWYGTPQRTVTVTTVGSRRPPRAGNKIHLDYKRLGWDVTGPFAEMDETGDYYITAVSRSYDEGGVATESWTLTSNAKQPPDATSRQDDNARGMVEALRVIPTTSVAIYPIETGRVKIGGSSIDSSMHTLVKTWEIPKTAYTIQQCKILLTIFPLRHDVAQTTRDGDHRHQITIPALTGTATISAIDESAGNAGFGNQFGHGHGSTAYGAQGGVPGGFGVAANQWNHNHGSSVPASGGGSVANSGQAGNLQNQINGHQHTTTFINGGNPDGASSNSNTSGIFYTTGSGSSNGGVQIQAVGRGGQMMTNPFNTNANGDHGHGSSVPAGGGGNVSGNNLGNGRLGTDGYGGFQPAVDGSGTGWVPHSYWPGATPVTTTGAVVLTDANQAYTGAHTHKFEVGIYEDNLPARVYITMDDGAGTVVDLTAKLSGPWSASWSESVDITGYLARSAGKKVVFTVSSVPVSGNPYGLTEVNLSGFGVIELSSVGSQVLYA